VTEALPAATGRPAPRLVLSTGRTGSTLLRLIDDRDTELVASAAAPPVMAAPRWIHFWTLRPRRTKWLRACRI